MGPSRKVAFSHILQRKNVRLLPKTPKKELLALKVWENCKNCKRKEKTLAGFEPAMQ